MLLLQLGLLNLIYRHIRWSNRENELIIDERHSSRHAATEEWLPVSDQLSGESAKRLRRLNPEWQSGGSAVGGEETTCSYCAPYAATKAEAAGVDLYKVNCVR